MIAVGMEKPPQTWNLTSHRVAVGCPYRRCDSAGQEIIILLDRKRQKRSRK